MNRIGLIQLSDLQFGAKHRFGAPSSISRSLVSDINSLAHRFNFIPTYLILSGDIAESGNGREYEDAYSQLETIRNSLNIDHDSVLVVPGNHDVCWDLSKVSQLAGNADLKFVNFHEFHSKITRRQQHREKNIYPIVNDSRNALQFLLIDSCEKETHDSHKGFIDPERLRNSIGKLDSSTENESGFLRIAVTHHRLDVTGGSLYSAVENYEEIEAIALHNNIHVVLTGHIHQGSVCVVEKDARRLFKSGAGSAGVSSQQREDGVSNQYSIFIIDRNLKQVESIFRSYNPTIRSRDGIGAWVIDSTFTDPPSFPIPFLRTYSFVSQDLMQDSRLVEKLGIVSNPFTFNNAEKISPEILLGLFVSDEARHKEAKRLTGDAIIRGPRGAGKTMFLRFLEIFGNIQFEACLREKRTAECFPVFIKFNLLHKSDISTTPRAAFDAADRLIYDSVISALDSAAEELRQPSFAEAVRKTKTRLDQLKNTQGPLISKLGNAFNEYLSTYSKHILLLMDEVASIFPREFFQDQDSGFVPWMNAIRNSGPFFTRVAVYPSDVSDILNEERFGSVINLEYNVRNHEEFVTFYKYCVDLVDNYLTQFSKNKGECTSIYSILERTQHQQADPLEQLIYASDGSTRRFLALMDRCLNACAAEPNPGKAQPLSKERVFGVIRTYAQNLVSGYSELDQQLAANIAKVCRKQVTFRFTAPGMSFELQALYTAREEFNILKLCDAGAGRRGAVYEFTYPYCVLNEIQTHNLKDTKRVNSNRSYIDGEWITSSARYEQVEQDPHRTARTTGIVREHVDGLCVITMDIGGYEVYAEISEGFDVGCRVSFSVSGAVANDVVKI